MFGVQGRQAKTETGAGGGGGDFPKKFRVSVTSQARYSGTEDLPTHEENDSFRV